MTDQMLEIMTYFDTFVALLILLKIYRLLMTDLRFPAPASVDAAAALLGTGLMWVLDSRTDFFYSGILVMVGVAVTTGLVLYRNSLRIALAAAGFYVLCVNSMDHMMYGWMAEIWTESRNFREMLENHPMAELAVTIAGEILWIGIYFLLKEFIVRFREVLNYRWTALLVSAAGFMGFVYLEELTIREFGFDLPEIWFLFTVLMFCIYFALYYLRETRTREAQNLALKLQNRLSGEKYEELARAYALNAKLSHEYRHQIRYLYQLLEQGETEQAREYLQELGMGKKGTELRHWTGVIPIDAVLNSMNQRMEEERISFAFDTNLTRSPGIAQQDLCSLLANILENAVEAVSALEERGCISLQVMLHHHFLLVTCENPCLPIREHFKTYPSTTKKDRSLHGWGLKNVEEIVKKYDGDLQCTADGDSFLIEIMLVEQARSESQR